MTFEEMAKKGDKVLEAICKEKNWIFESTSSTNKFESFDGYINTPENKIKSEVKIRPDLTPEILSQRPYDNELLLR